MSNKISQELSASRKYKLLLDDNTNHVQLSLNNVALVEAFICYDSDYAKSGNKNAVPTVNYSGSTAFWMCELKKLLNCEKSNYSYENVLREAVSAVDRENSTHINADGVGRDELAGRLLKISKKQLLGYLKSPGQDYKLIQILSEKTKPVEKNKYARENYSFATKFCHYACMWLFEGEDEQDNFSIYDNIVAKAIGWYADFYKIKYKASDLKMYAKYIALVDKIIAASKSGISRNGFDHLLWYYYKAQ